jgi:hypothetical protein
MIKEVLEKLETAKEFADLGVVLAGALKGFQFGEKGAEVLEVALTELDSLLKPISTRYKGWKTRKRDERLAFVQKATGDDEVEEVTALAILKMGDDEHAVLMKTIETEIWKFRAKDAEVERDVEKKKSSTIDLLGQILKAKRPTTTH